MSVEIGWLKSTNQNQNYIKYMLHIELIFLFEDRDELELNGKHAKLRMQHHSFESGPSEKMLYGTEHWD